MPVHVIRDKEDPACWRVEEMDFDGLALALFAGQDAERRARDYAELLKQRHGHSSSVNAWWEHEL